MAKMKAVQIPEPGADSEIVERDVPDPGSGRIRVKAARRPTCR